MRGAKTCGGFRPHMMTIEKPRTAKDAAGQIDLTVDANWQFAGKRSVRFITKGGRESRVFDQTQADSDVVLDFNSDSFTRSMLPSWRGKIGTRRFNFKSVQDVDEARDKVLVHATEAK